MAELDKDETGLELFFAAARREAPEPSADLMARVLADAGANLPRPAAPVAAPRRSGLVAALLAAVGGWPALAGLATATVAGIWIGYSAPAGLTTLAEALWSGGDVYDVADLVPSVDLYLTEGGT